MKSKLFYFLVVLTTNIYSQNPADIDLIIGSGYKGFSYVSVMKQQPDGKIVVGGYMAIGTQGLTGEASVVRFNTDGSIDTSFESPLLTYSGVLNDLVLQPDGKILVGGDFSLMNGVNSRQIIRLNTDGSKDNSFVPTIGGRVESIALQPDGKILIAGSSSTFINGHLQRYVFRLNADGTTDPTFDLGSIGFSFSATAVYKVVVQSDGKVIVGGYFNFFNSQPQGKLIRFNSDGTKDNSFDIGTGALNSNAVRDIELQPDGKILVSGGFTSWNGQPAGSIIRLNYDGSLDSSFFLAIPNAYAPDIALQQDGKIVAIGTYTVNGVLNRAVQLNSDGSLTNTLQNLRVGNAANCVAVQSDDKILIGGFLNSINGVAKNSLARLNTDGSLDMSFNLNTGLNDKVEAVAVQVDGKTILGGAFTTFEGISQNRIIRILDDGSKDLSFAIGSGFNNTIYTIVIQPDGKILVGGNFTQFNGVNTNSILRLNNDGTLDSSFAVSSGFNDYVKIILLQPDGKILIGGNFTTFNGQPQNYCVRLNNDGTLDNSFSVATAFNGRISCFGLQPDGKIIMGGNFTTFNGQTQNHLIRLNSDGTKDPSFEIGTGIPPSNHQHHVREIKILPNGNIYVLASAVWYNENSIKQPFRLFPNGTLDSSFVSSVTINGTTTIDALAVQQDGKIILGGDFYALNGINPNQRRLVRLNTDGSYDSGFDVGDGNPEHYGGLDPGICSEIVVMDDGKIWLAGSFFTYRSICSFSAIRLVGDTVVLSTPDFDANENEIILYPNPTKDIVTLQYDLTGTNATVAIFDVTGRLIQNVALNSVTGSSELNVSSYPAGVYLVLVKQGAAVVFSSKLVVE